MDSDLKSIIKGIIDNFNSSGVVWKVENNKHYGEHHLKRRKNRNELTTEWELKDYNNHILNIINGINNDVHLYYLETFTQKDFTFDDGSWIVIIGENGVMETCMIGKPSNYFKKNPGYTYLGKVKDVLK